MSLETAYTLHLSTRMTDLEWDDFVAKIPGGEFEQTSMWAQAKSIYGWSPVRCFIRRQGNITAGFQILRKKIHNLVCIGYISRGPLATDPESRDLQSILLQAISDVVNKFGILVLFIHLPVSSNNFLSRMYQYGFRESSLVSVCKATLRIDLSQRIDEIFSSIKKKVRTQIRQGYKRGTYVRPGNRNDISTFFNLMLMTCARQGVEPNPPDEKYLEKLWDAFSSWDSIKLFIAENDGKPLSACWNIAFGDTVRYWKVGWSGENSELRPNQIMVWESIKWAKENGFSYFDFFGISEEAAESMRAPKNRAFENIDGKSSYKLNFGGQAVFYPPGFLYITNPIVRHAWHYAHSHGLGKLFIGLVSKIFKKF